MKQKQPPATEQSQRGESMYDSYDRNPLNEPNWTGQQRPATAGGQEWTIHQNDRGKWAVLCNGEVVIDNLYKDRARKVAAAHNTAAKQPPATESEQEWTIHHPLLASLSHNHAGNIAKTHNAALARLRLSNEGSQTSLLNAVELLQRQLAAEREKLKPLVDALGGVIFWLHQNEQVMQDACLLNVADNRRWRDALAEVKEK